MSLILDALKRAERERKLEKAPDLSAIYQEGRLNRRKYYPWFWAGGSFLAAFVILAFLFWPKEPSRDDIKDKTPVSPPIASAPANRSQQKEPSPPIPVARKTVKNSVLPTSAPTAENKVLKTQKKIQILEKPVPVSQEKTKPTPDSVKTPPEKTADTAAIKSPRPKNVGAREKLALEPVKQIVAPKAAVAVVPPPKPKVTLPTIHDLPENIQSALGPLEINVHMYSQNPSERRVFINMKSYREGDTIGESGFRLAEITPNGVVIDYGKGKAVLGVKHK
jgi:general secretion pathway protein B